MHWCLWLSICSMNADAYRDQKEGLGSLGAEVAGGCEPPNMGAGT